MPRLGCQSPSSQRTDHQSTGSARRNSFRSDGWVTQSLPQTIDKSGRHSLLAQENALESSKSLNSSNGGESYGLINYLLQLGVLEYAIDRGTTIVEL